MFSHAPAKVRLGLVALMGGRLEARVSFWVGGLGIKAAFFDLLASMWLDRYPHAFIAVPALMRSFDPSMAVKENCWLGQRASGKQTRGALRGYPQNKPHLFGCFFLEGLFPLWCKEGPKAQPSLCGIQTHILTHTLLATICVPVGRMCSMCLGVWLGNDRQWQLQPRSDT